MWPALIFSLVLGSQVSFPQAAQAADGLQFYIQNTSSWSPPPTAIDESSAGYCNKTISNIDSDWGGDTAFGLSGCDVDNFTVYGTGYIIAPFSGVIEFCSQTDDQYYLRIDTTNIIDDNSAKAAASGQSCNGTLTMTMVSGTKYPLESWMHEQGGGAEQRLLWKYSDAALYTIIPLASYSTTNVSETSSFNSFALAGSATVATYRTTILITANVTVASKVTFRASGVIIPGCKNKATSGSSPNIVATCSWKPARRGVLSLTATAVPISTAITASSATPFSVLVGTRTGAR